MAENYTLVQPSANIFEAESWERLGKFYALHISAGFITVLGMVLIALIVTPKSRIVALILGIGFVLSIQSLFISLYEHWRGCHIKGLET